MKPNIIKEKTYQFSIRIVYFYKYLREEKNEYVLCKQILRSGTSIGANVEEAIGGISRRDFVAKMQISYKEARETEYWLRLLHDTEYVEDKLFHSLMLDVEEILKLLSKILTTTKNRIKN